MGVVGGRGGGAGGRGGVVGVGGSQKGGVILNYKDKLFNK